MRSVIVRPLTILQVWDEVYASNLAVYRVKMAAYKAGQPIPDDAEAQRLVEMGKAPAPHEVEVDVEEEDESEDEPEPVKAPEPPKSAKRRKSEKSAPEPVVPAP